MHDRERSTTLTSAWLCTRESRVQASRKAARARSLCSLSLHQTLIRPRILLPFLLTSSLLRHGLHCMIRGKKRHPSTVASLKSSFRYKPYSAASRTASKSVSRIPVALPQWISRYILRQNTMVDVVMQDNFGPDPVDVSAIHSVVCPGFRVDRNVCCLARVGRCHSSW